MAEPGRSCDRSIGTHHPAPAARLLASVKAILLLALLLLAFVGLRFTEVGSSLSKERVQAFVNGLGVLAPAAHILLYAVGTTLLVPATVFILVGAVVFGKGFGSLYNVLGGIGGATLSFLAARSLGREFVAQWLTRRLRELDARVERRGFLLILYLRLAYVPFAPLNYAAGLTGIPFLAYLAGTALGVVPATVIFTVFLDEATSLTAPADLLSRRFLAPAVLFILSWLLPFAVKRLAPDIRRTTSPPGA